MSRAASALAFSSRSFYLCFIVHLSRLRIAREVDNPNLKFFVKFLEAIFLVSSEILFDTATFEREGRKIVAILCESFSTFWYVPACFWNSSLFEALKGTMWSSCTHNWSSSSLPHVLPGAHTKRGDARAYMGLWLPLSSMQSGVYFLCQTALCYWCYASCAAAYYIAYSSPVFHVFLATQKRHFSSALYEVFK
jgi:hypothetical protein